MKDSPSLGIAPLGVYEIILSALFPIRGSQILDIPCASGGFAQELAREGAICVAADLNAGPCHRPMVVVDMNFPLPFSEGSFDIITCIEGIEHIHDPFLLVREFHRVLRPGGRLVLTTPNIHNLRSRLKFLLRGTLFWFDSQEISHIGHINVIPYFILKHILSVSGFVAISSRTNRPIQPKVPQWIARAMQRLFSGDPEDDRELNSPEILSGEGLIVFARKP